MKTLTAAAARSLEGRILITGGAGFIGSALAWALNRRGHQDLYIVDRLGTSEKWKNLRSLRYSEYWEVAEFERLLAQKQLPKFSCILHLGACSSTTQSDASYLMRNNYRFSLELAQFALENESRFLYASSAATYGDGRWGYSESAPLDKLRPLNVYGYSKQMVDCWMQQQGWLDWAVALKFFNVFGPNEAHKADMRSVVAKSYLQLQEQNKIQLFESHRADYSHGHQRRDFLYVKDAVDMVLFLAEHPTAGIFNLGSGLAQTWLDLVRPIFESVNRAENIEFIPMPEQLRDKYQYHTQADLEGLARLGYPGPRWELTKAVRDYVCNYLVGGHHLGDPEVELGVDL